MTTISKFTAPDKKMRSGLSTPPSMDIVWEEVVKYQWGFGGKPIMPDTTLHTRSEDVYNVINQQRDVVSVAPQFLRPPYQYVPFR